MWVHGVLLIIFELLTVSCTRNDTDQQRLAKMVFENYNKKFRPVVRAADIVNVTLNPAVYSIVRVDEVAESITILQYFRMTWKDAFLVWNMSDFGELRELLMPMSEIWYPDVVVNNVINIRTPISAERNYAVIDRRGKISVEISQILTMHCVYDVTMFPFDIQNCTMELGAWAYEDTELDIYYTSPTDTTFYQNSSEWDLISVSARRKKERSEDGLSSYVIVYYDILIQRKPTYYILTFILPCFIITMISVVGIFAPFSDAGHREEKVTIGLTTLLTMIVILSLITDKMPKNSDGLPLLGTYIMSQVAMDAVTSLFAVIVMYQNRKWTTGEPLPCWILALTRVSCRRNSLTVEKANNAAYCSQKSETDESKGHGSSTLIYTYQQQQLATSKSILFMARRAAKRLQEQREEESLRREWHSATDRLDLLLMITFLMLNCILTAYLLILGYSNLQI